MRSRLVGFKNSVMLGLLLLSSILTPTFASALDFSTLLTPAEVEYQSSILDLGFSSVEEYEAYQRDPRDRRPGPGRGDRDRDRRRDRRPPPPPPGRRPPPPIYFYECYARNGRGQTFMARDRYDSWYAQREAMRQCYRYSHNCYELGCRQIHR